MSDRDRFGIDLTAVVALVAVFVVVASATGAGTYTVLSDDESVSANVTIEPNLQSGMVRVDPIQCSPKIKSKDSSKVNSKNI